MGGGGAAIGGDLGGDLGGGDMDMGTGGDLEGGGATGSADMSAAPDASAGVPLQESRPSAHAVRSVIDQYLDMLTEKQKEKEGDSEEKVQTILEESEEQAKGLDFLLEKVEKLIGEDDAFKTLGLEEEENISGETGDIEEILDNEE